MGLCVVESGRPPRPRFVRSSAASDGYRRQVVLTSDNPRNEEPEAILAEMEQGVQAQHFHKLQTITDRRQAIQAVCKSAKKGDIILIAGKGHETYQEIKGIKHDFDDFKIVQEYLALYKK